MSMFKPREWEDPKIYSKKLTGYTVEELEDVYNHIHILKQPLYYNLLVREMEARGIIFGRKVPPRSFLDIRRWLGSLPILKDFPLLRGAVLACILLAATTLLTFAMFMPIWLFAVPLKFLGIQTALVYLAISPISPVLGLSIGAKLGGKGWYSIFVVVGVVLGMWMFNATGTPSLIIDSVMKPDKGGQSMFGGF